MFRKKKAIWPGRLSSNNHQSMNLQAHVE